MFSGIIESLGVVERITHQNEMAELVIGTGPDFSDFESGESIAVNGVCLTVRGFTKNSFTVDLSTETLNRTSFSEIQTQSKVNLERSLTPSGKISGHFVSGHIDRMGTVAGIETKSGETLFQFEHPPELAPLIIEKGSIAIDGISLTAFSCRDSKLTVSIIPFTLEHTNLSDRKIGDRVNIECDMIGKYVVRACENFLNQPGKHRKLSLDFLREQGFL
ncbi:MAG: riboflavin synthase [Nitrospinaceae bacterium]